MRFRFPALQLICLLIGAASGHVFADDGAWMRSSFIVLHRDADVTLMQKSGERVDFGEKLPLILADLVAIDTQESGRLYLEQSNGVRLGYWGPGELLAERLDERVNLENTETLQTLTILNLKEGALFLDTRALALDSIYNVETPIGRVTGSQALWRMDLKTNQRLSGYDLEIDCFGGELWFFDRYGNKYFIPSGSRLIGLSSPANLSAEVSEITQGDQIRLDIFVGYTEAFDATYDTAALREKMQYIRGVKPFLTQGESVVRDEPTDRPIIIEYVPRMELMTPYRGVPRGISKYRAKLF